MVGPKKRKGTKVNVKFEDPVWGEAGKHDSTLPNDGHKKPMQVWIHLKWMSNLPIVPLNFLLENISVLDFQFRIFPVGIFFQTSFEKKSSVFLACDPGWLKKANQQKANQRWPKRNEKPRDDTVLTNPMKNEQRHMAPLHRAVLTGQSQEVERALRANPTGSTMASYHTWEYGCFQK